jgi:enoyl-CoA hydratase/carnithine racemase
MNAMGENMREILVAALDEIDTDPEIRVILLTGKGAAFCAGDDLKRDKTKDTGPAGFGPLLQRLGALRIPVIGAINGWCIGGGFELALTCDIRIASTEARFTAAGVNMGLMSSAYRLPRLIGVSRAKAILLTGSPVDAVTAEHYGLVTALHPPEDLEEAALTLARRVASRAPLSVEATKLVTGRAMDLSPEDAAQMQGELLKVLRASRDHAEAVTAFREKRDPVFTRS